MDIERLRVRNAEIVHRLQEIEAMPEDAARSAAQSQALNDEIDSLTAEYDRNDRLIRVADVSRASGNRESGFGAGNGGASFIQRGDPFDVSVRTAADNEVRSRALKVLEDKERSRHLATEQLDQVDALVRADTEDLDGSYVARRMLITEAPAYRSAWQRVMTGVPGQTFLTAEESAALRQLEHLDRVYYGRAMSEGTNSAGGFGVPVLIDPTIILTSGAADAPILRVCRVETITTNVWKGVSSAGVSWGYKAEGAPAPDASPTVAQPQVPVYLADGWIPYSIELSMDYPQFASEMAKLLEAGYVDLLAQQTVVGSGVNSPRGIFTALAANTNVQVNTTTNGSFGPPDVFKVWGSLKERYRNRATWLQNVAIENAIRQFGTNANSSAYFTVDLTADGITRINGRPTIVTDYAPSTLPTTGSQNLLVVGDFSNYLIAQRAGMQVEQVQTLFDQATGRPTGQRGWLAYARHGADSINDLGFRLLIDS